MFRRVFPDLHRGGIMADSFGYMASISAVLGGFAFTFLGVLLTTERGPRATEWTARAATLAAAILAVCALGWGLGASQLARAAAADPAAVLSRAADLRGFHRGVSLLFLAGIFCFMASLGLSGWVRSRSLGIFTTVTALVAAVATVLVLRLFIS